MINIFVIKLRNFFLIIWYEYDRYIFDEICIEKKVIDINIWLKKASGQIKILKKL